MPGWIALAGKQLWRDGEITQLGQAATDVLDMFMHAEDFLHHQYRRQRLFPSGCRPIGWNLAAWDRDLDLARNQPLVICRDGGRGWPSACSRGESCRQRRHQKRPAPHLKWLRNLDDRWEGFLHLTP